MGGFLGSPYPRGGAVAAPPSALLTGLEAYWKLDEASGQRNDSHGANHLTDNNTVGSAVGKLGNAADFIPANSEYLSIADNASLSAGDIDFTIACWVFVDAAVERGFVCKDAIGSREFNLVTEANSKVNFYVSPDGTALVAVTEALAISTGAWHYLVAWHDSVANTINLQTDDGAVVSTAHATGVNNGTAAFHIGSLRPTLYFMDGLIDSVGFWKRVLTAGERTSLYNGGAGLEYPF